MKTGRSTAGDTKARILDATERLFIEVGYEGTSLRQVTSRAIVNLAAVNYHFRSKDIMMQAVLSRRLDPLNARRLALLDACEASWPGEQIRCEHVMGALFVPALQMAREPGIGGPAFLRLLGRVYSDTSPFIQSYLMGHYAPVFGRFFDAFARALPELPRQELGWRLHFALKALAGVLAGDDLGNLMPAFTQGKTMSDAHVLAQLSAMVVAALKAPAPAEQQLGALHAVFEIGERQHADESVRQPAQPEGSAPSQPSTRAAAEPARRVRTSTRSEGAARAAVTSLPVRGSSRERPPPFPSNPLDDWMRTRSRN
ncbi:TetR family transcriptional regulator [Cupriavidus sp. USMAA2-4]|uniref:TetR/AcrR family transcriptional regulator n=1 Tax=unclassified Cupriavidus TaxID=2640874 RepID=UPI0008A6A059|nr:MULTISPECIES: TetR/AcrR family transcriptional regulator [unclassified Cupriavidus]AOY92251.1 TetR family transcriptional regulator [Cupriavidus sp. USMAA2-4]AOY98169.1 TetR family transcriptional regulator [Cupriavidus sp. USMAHM13]